MTGTVADGKPRDNLARLVSISREIARQPDYARMFRQVVEEACSLLQAEGGTLYLYDQERHCLTAVVALNSVIGLSHMIEVFSPSEITGMFSIEIEGAGRAQVQRSIAGECWRRQEAIVIADTAAATGFDLTAMHRFDAEHGYHSRAVVAVPLLTRDEQVLGVVQVVNPALGLAGGEELGILSTMSGFIGMAVENKLLLWSADDLLKSVIEMVSTAIDEKSKTTSGHCHRVTELTMMLAEEMAADTTGPYRDFSMTREEHEQLRTAALLHDIGKIATPDHVLEKSRKLEKTFDKIEYLRVRHLLRQESRRAQLLENALRDAGLPLPAAFDDGEEMDFRFLEQTNIGGESLDDTDVMRLRKIANRPTPDGGLIPAADLEDLEIRRGTLNVEERHQMEQHAAISIRLLSKLPWPAHLDQVPEIAGKHHENCDGSGYPNGLTGAEMSLQAKILSLTDRFEGLSATDRNYRKPKTLAQVMAIMASMSERDQIDPELYRFFVDREVHIKYLRRFLPELLAQVDG